MMNLQEVLQKLNKKGIDINEYVKTNSIFRLNTDRYYTSLILVDYFDILNNKDNFYMILKGVYSSGGNISPDSFYDTLSMYDGLPYPYNLLIKMSDKRLYKVPCIEYNPRELNRRINERLAPIERYVILRTFKDRYPVKLINEATSIPPERIQSIIDNSILKLQKEDLQEKPLKPGSNLSKIGLSNETVSILNEVNIFYESELYRRITSVTTLLDGFPDFNDTTLNDICSNPLLDRIITRKLRSLVREMKISKQEIPYFGERLNHVEDCDKVAIFRWWHYNRSDQLEYVHTMRYKNDILLWVRKYTRDAIMTFIENTPCIDSDGESNPIIRNISTDMINITSFGYDDFEMV